MTEERMAEGLTERLEQLEKSVRRAAETITRLRKERDSLQAKVAGLEAKLGAAEAIGPSWRACARSGRKSCRRWTAS